MRSTERLWRGSVGTKVRNKPWEGNHYTSGQSTSGPTYSGRGCYYGLLFSSLFWVVLFLCLTGCRTSVAIHGLSDHEKPRLGGREWNEVNPGLGVRVDVATGWAEAGTFKNSFSDMAPYAGYAHRLVNEGGFEIGLFVGAADYAQGLRPLAFTYARAGYLQIAWSPDVGQYGGQLTTFGLVIPLTR